MITCTNCGAGNPTTAILCQQCGYSLNPNQAGQAPMPVPRGPYQAYSPGTGQAPAPYTHPQPQQPYQPAASPYQPLPPHQPQQVQGGYSAPALQQNSTQSAAAPSKLATMASTALRGASLEATPTERNSIRIMKMLGWIYLIVSVLVTLGVLILFMTSANTMNQLSPTLGNLVLLEGVLVAAIVLIQGAGAWAASQVVASITESLIMIRKNTA